MAYTPTVWATGDVITAEKLNKAENGIADANAKNAVFTITETNVDGVHTLSKTWQQISDEFEDGNLCVIRAVAAGVLTYNNFVDDIDYLDNDGVITYRVITAEFNYLCDSADAHPVYDENES